MIQINSIINFLDNGAITDIGDANAPLIGLKDIGKLSDYKGDSNGFISLLKEITAEGLNSHNPADFTSIEANGNISTKNNISILTLLTGIKDILKDLSNRLTGLNLEPNAIKQDIDSEPDNSQQDILQLFDALNSSLNSLINYLKHDADNGFTLNEFLNSDTNPIAIKDNLEIDHEIGDVRQGKEIAISAGSKDAAASGVNDLIETDKFSDNSLLNDIYKSLSELNEILSFYNTIAPYKEANIDSDSLKKSIELSDMVDENEQGSLNKFFMASFSQQDTLKDISKDASKDIKGIAVKAKPTKGIIDASIDTPPQENGHVTGSSPVDTDDIKDLSVNDIRALQEIIRATLDRLSPAYKAYSEGIEGADISRNSFTQADNPIFKKGIISAKEIIKQDIQVNEEVANGLFDEVDEAKSRLYLSDEVLGGGDMKEGAAYHVKQDRYQDKASIDDKIFLSDSDREALPQKDRPVSTGRHKEGVNLNMKTILKDGAEVQGKTATDNNILTDNMDIGDKGLLKEGLLEKGEGAINKKIKRTLNLHASSFGGDNLKIYKGSNTQEASQRISPGSHEAHKGFLNLSGRPHTSGNSLGNGSDSLVDRDRQIFNAGSHIKDGIEGVSDAFSIVNIKGDGLEQEANIQINGSNQARPLEETIYWKDKELNVEFVRMVSKRVGNAVQRGENKLLLKIHPPELGKIEIDLHVNHDDNSVRLNFIAEAREVKGILQHNHNILKETLAQNGFSLSDFNVDVSGHEQGLLDGNSAWGFSDKRDGNAPHNRQEAFSFASENSESAAQKQGAGILQSDEIIIGPHGVSIRI